MLSSNIQSINSINDYSIKYIIYIPLCIKDTKIETEKQNQSETKINNLYVHLLRLT